MVLQVKLAAWPAEVLSVPQKTLPLVSVLSVHPAEVSVEICSPPPLTMRPPASVEEAVVDVEVKYCPTTRPATESFA